MAPDRSRRREPAKTEEDWADIWGYDARLAALEQRQKRVDRVIGPVVAFAENWKAWGIAAGLLVFLNRPDIEAIFRAIGDLF